MKKNENFKKELETQYSILIKAEENDKRRKNIIIITILSITLISTLLSLGFSYQSFKYIKDNKKTEIKENTLHTTLSTTFNNGSLLSVNNIRTGYVLESPKVITITNEGDTEITYNIKLVSIKTSLLSTNNLVYKITKHNETSNTKELPLVNNNIVTEAKIAPKETTQYILEVQYNGILDDYSVSNNYQANILVEQVNNSINVID